MSKRQLANAWICYRRQDEYLRRDAARAAALARATRARGIAILQGAASRWGRQLIARGWNGLYAPCTAAREAKARRNRSLTLLRTAAGRMANRRTAAALRKWATGTLTVAAEEG